jgi:hypothetical protein
MSACPGAEVASVVSSTGAQSVIITALADTKIVQDRLGSQPKPKEVLTV